MARRTASLIACAAIGATCIVGVVAGSGARADADSSATVPCTFHGNLPASNDTSSPAVPLGFTLSYYGASYSSVYVNNNGSVTFGAAEPTLTKFDNHAGTPREIAPFAADVDTRGAGSGLTHWGTTTYNGQHAFCVDWGNPSGAGVGYYNGHADKLDWFQLVLVASGGGNFSALFNYNKLTWDSGDAQGGSDGTGGAQPASAGFLAGDGNPQHVYAINGSGETDTFLDATGCSDVVGAPQVRRHGLAGNGYNSTIMGRWSFQVANGLPVMPVVELGGGSFVEGDTGNRTYKVAATLETPSASPVSVQYSVLQGPHDTATPGADFVPVADATVSVQPQVQYNCLVQTTVQLPVTVIGDTAVEPDESFTIALDSAEGAALGARSSSRATIFNDDPGSGVHVDVNNAGIVEGNKIATPPYGTNKVCFTLTLSAPVNHPVTGTYDVVAGTATAGVDFDPIPTTSFTIGTGRVQAGSCILVGVHADTVKEPDETFDLQILSANGATIGHGVGIGTIRNDD